MVAVVGHESPREQWAIRRPLLPEEVARGEQIKAILLAEAEATGQPVKFDVEHLNHTFRIWSALELANPIIPLQREAHIRHLAQFDAEHPNG